MQLTAPNVEEIFYAALELESPGARSAFLDKVCGDTELRRRVERLLAVDARGGDFLEAPASMLTVTVAADPRSVIEELGTTIGPYKLMEVIGEGGMGAVYMAEQSEPVRRRVALKVIKPGMDSKQVVARFEAERQALAMMDHPNIAKVHDGGVTPAGRPYFVMELVRGLPVTDYCDQQQLSIPERLELFVLVCRAVQHAHQKGVIHRDLKPSNVLVTVIDGVATPKVIDFGVAKATGGVLTNKTLFTGFHQFVGTPLYVSPEQAELSGVDVDTRSDIYSLGVLLYELLTGTTPFDPETLKRAAFDEMRRILREEEPPKPSTRLSSLGDELSTVSARRKADPKRLGASVKGELDWVVMKALEKDRRRRYETANDFAADVMRYLTDRPVEAFPPSARYRFMKFTRRNRVALTTASSVTLVLLVGTTLSIWQAMRATAAERRAEARSEQARKAVDEMYTQVAEKWLAQQPKLTAVQREFLAKALAFYQQFAAEQANDPQAKFEAARARHRVGLISSRLDRSEEAGEAYRQSIEQLQDLAGRYPGRDEFVSELAWYSIDLGGLEVHLGRLGEAEPILKRAVAVLEDLERRSPKDREVRSRLANSLGALGSLYERQGRNQEAEPLLLRGRDLYAALHAEGPLGPRHRDRYPNCEVNLGLVYKNTGRLPQAEEALRHAAEHVQSLLTEEGQNPSYRELLAIAVMNLAGTQDERGQSGEALASDLRGIALFEALAAEFPDVPRYRAMLAECEANVFIMLSCAGRVDEAGRHARRAVDLSEELVRDHPDVPEYRNNLARGLSFVADLHSMSPEDPHHDPALATRLALRAVELKTNASMLLGWQSLGWARYRAGDWKGCIEALEKQDSYAKDGDFFGAMAYWKLGDEARARELFRKMDRWFEHGYEKRPGVYPIPAKLKRIRDEAAALMDIPDRPSSTKKDRPEGERPE